MAEEKTGLQEETAVDEMPEDGDEAANEQEKLKEAINVDVEEVGTLRKKLTITVPADTLGERRSEQYSELKRDAVVPGFRKGHAPLKLIEKRFGDEVGGQLLSQLLGSSFMAAIDKVELKTVGDPLIWVNTPPENDKDGEPIDRLVSVDKAIDIIEMPEDGELTYACEVEVRPEFELPKLDGIAVEKPKIEIGDEDVQKQIDRLRSMRGQYVPVSDAVKEDDMIVADVTIKVGDDTLAEHKNSELHARPQFLSGIMMEDLGEKVTGKKAGDSVNLTAPIRDDHENLDYRGKTADIAVTIHDVKRLELPPVDQEFLESIGMDSEDELRGEIRQNLEAELDSVIKRGMRGQIGKYLLEETKLDIPEGLSRRQTERLVARRMVEMFQQGMSEQEVSKQVDELRARAGEDAVQELKLFFIMEKVAEEMETDVSDDEMNGAIAMMAQQQRRRFDRVRDDLAKGDGLTALYLQLRDDKILDELLEKATITEVDGPKKSSKSGGAKKKKAAGSAKKKKAAKSKDADE